VPALLFYLYLFLLFCARRERRFREHGDASAAVTKLKRNVIKSFFEVEKLRTNFRLAQLLAHFKQRADAWTNSSGDLFRGGGGGTLVKNPRGKEASGSVDGHERSADFAREYILQSTPHALDQMYAEPHTWHMQSRFMSTVQQLTHTATWSVHVVRSRGFSDLFVYPFALDRFDDFEAMFPGGKGEAAALDFAALCEKPDLDQALIDCMM